MSPYPYWMLCIWWDFHQWFTITFHLFWSHSCCVLLPSPSLFVPFILCFLSKVKSWLLWTTSNSIKGLSTPHMPTHTVTQSHTDTHSSEEKKQKKNMTYTHKCTSITFLHTHKDTHTNVPPSLLHTHTPSLYCTRRHGVHTALPPPLSLSGTHYVGQWLVSADWASGKKNTIISALGYSCKGDKSWYEVWNPKSFSRAAADKLGLICACVHACVSKVFTFAHFPFLK